MFSLILPYIIAAIHVSYGPHGIVAWVQPPHIAAGAGVVRWHLVTWWQVQ